MRLFKNSIFLSLIVLLGSFFSCAKGERTQTDFEKWVNETGKIKVLVTTAMIEDLVKRVGQDHVSVIAMIKEDADPHSYEIVKGDDEKFFYADVVFSNGLQLEHSASMQHQLSRHRNVVRLGDELFSRFPEKMIHVDQEIDPHIWMDVSLWSKLVPIVADKLCEIDPVHSSDYKRYQAQVEEEMAAKDKELFALYQAIPKEKRYLVTSHDAFNYHVRRYFASEDEIREGTWKKRFKALQGLAPDEQISSLEIKDLVAHITSFDIDIIFPEANLSKDSLEKVKESCSRLGKKIALSSKTLYGDTLGGKTYFEMLDHNARLIQNELKGAQNGE